jgi:hypothetical protein
MQFLQYLDQICRETDTGNLHKEDPLYSQTLPALQDSVQHMSRDMFLNYLIPFLHTEYTVQAVNIIIFI